MMPKVALMVKTKVRPGKRAEAYAHYQKHLAPRARENEAREVVMWCLDDEDPDTIYLFEVYRDRGSLFSGATIRGDHVQERASGNRDVGSFG